MSAYKIITNGPQFAVIFAHVRPVGEWTHYTDQAFATKEAAQEWLSSELEAWSMLDEKPAKKLEAA